MEIPGNIFQLLHAFLGKLLQDGIAVHQHGRELADEGFGSGVAADGVQHGRVDETDLSPGIADDARNGQGGHKTAGKGQFLFKLVHHDVEGAPQIADFILRRIGNAADFILFHHAHGKGGRLLERLAHAATRKQEGTGHAYQQRPQHAQREVERNFHILPALLGLAGGAALDAFVQLPQRLHDFGNFALIGIAEHQRTRQLHVRRRAVAAPDGLHGPFLQLHQRVGEIDGFAQQLLFLGRRPLLPEQIRQRHAAPGGHALVRGTGNFTCPFIHDGMIFPFVLGITGGGKTAHLLRQHAGGLHHFRSQRKGSFLPGIAQRRFPDAEAQPQDAQRHKADKNDHQQIHDGRTARNSH